VRHNLFLPAEFSAFIDNAHARFFDRDVQTTFYHQPEAQHLPSFPVGEDGARSRLPHLVRAWPRCLLPDVSEGF
jgi:hypothetical protein